MPQLLKQRSKLPSRHFLIMLVVCTNENLKLYKYKDHLSIRNFYKITLSG
jgi:hypothetical protein